MKFSGVAGSDDRPDIIVSAQQSIGCLLQVDHFIHVGPDSTQNPGDELEPYGKFNDTLSDEELEVIEMANVIQFKFGFGVMFLE
jgi:hypothetical protein